MKNEAVIYKRVSTTEQVDNMSLDEQEKSCKTFCANKDLKVVKIFADEGESAKTADRTQLKELLEYCRANRKTVGHVVVYKIDRFARSVQDHTALQVLLKKMEIILWSATEPIGETTTGKLMEHVLASFAQFDNDLRSERCSAGMIARTLEGGWVVNAPLGYVNVKDELKRPTLAYGDKRTVKAIRKFFDMFSTGKYLQNDVVKVAADCGLRTTSGNPLSRTGAIGLLNNVVYAGKIKNKMTGEKVIDGLHPAIIEYSQWKAIQDILAGRRRSYAKPARFKPFFPLKRYLRCGNCGHKLTGSAPRGGSGISHPSYHCTKCTIRRDGVRVSIPKAKAHEDFAAQLDKLVPSEWAMEVFKAIVLKRWDKDFRDVQQERKAIDLELTKLEKRRNTLFDMMGDGKIKNEKSFNEQISRLEVKQEELEFERDEKKTVEVDKRKIINEAVYFLAHAGEIWRTATAENKVLFQKLVYEGGVALYPDQTFGTSEPSEIYKQITDIEKSRKTTAAELPSENSAVVHPTRLERQMRVLALKLAYALTRVYKRLRLPGIPGVLVVLSYEDMVVLVRHTYGTDDWTLPGGLRWWHESAHARARKEIAEELGITPPQLTSLGEVRSGNSKLELFTGELDDWRTRRNVELAEVGFFKKSQLPALGDAACIAIQRFGWELPAVES